MIENSGKDIGTLLKEQREKLGYSLHDAAQHTRIRESSLESIESNRFSDLPGQVYVTGFIKVYANYLGVDSKPLLKQLEESRLNAGPSPVKIKSADKHQTLRVSQSSSGAGRSIFIFGFLAVLIISGAMYFLSPIFQDENLVKATQMQATPEQKPVLQSDAVQVDSARQAGESEQGGASSPGAEAMPAVAESESPELEPLPSVSPDGSSLRMLALTEGSLVIYLDDRASNHYKLHDGLDLTWTVKKTVRVEMAGPETARFWLDGQELDLGERESFQLQTVAGD
ncbi:MAG: helix-turn-helix domain-containing protein [Desulfuromonadales bacterium]